MGKTIISGNDAKEVLIKGINILNDTIKITLGPKGRNVVIDNLYTTPFITNDGATIAREITLDDPVLNIGVELVKEVALKTNDLAGDGTTTATILATELINQGVGYIKEGVNPIILNQYLEKCSSKVIDYLKTISSPIETIQDIQNIAFISSGNSLISNLIAKAYEAVGFHGLITIEESKQNKTHLEIVNGFHFDASFLSNYLLTDEEKQMAILDHPYILITDEKIIDISSLSPILNAIIEENASLVIIAAELSDSVLQTLILNKMQNILNVTVIDIPDDSNRFGILNDLAIVTGGKFLDCKLGIPIELVKKGDLGRAKQVIVTKENATVIDGFGNHEDIMTMKKTLEHELLTSDSDFYKEQLTNRIANINQIAAVIKIGANSKLESTELKMKIEDALCSCKSAILEGILPGGETSLIKGSNALESLKSSTINEEAISAKIVISALKKPFETLLINANITNINEYIKQITESDDFIGLNILTEQVVDMRKEAIIDPAKVLIVAISSAVSIAKMILTTEAIIVDKSNNSLLKKERSDNLITSSINGEF